MWAVTRISLWFDAVSNWQAWLFHFTVVNLTLSGVTATGNVFAKIRLEIFSQLSGSPRVLRSQTVNLPGVCPRNMTRNQKWHVTSEKRVLFSSWLTGLFCLREPRTGLWHPPFILSAFQTFHFHDRLREWHIFRIFPPWVRTFMHQCCLILSSADSHWEIQTQTCVRQHFYTSITSRQDGRHDEKDLRGSHRNSLSLVSIWVL